jgi:hypothetical protein
MSIRLSDHGATRLAEVPTWQSAGGSSMRGMTR